MALMSSQLQADLLHYDNNY